MSAKEDAGGIVGCDKDILRIVGDLPASITPAEEFYVEADPMRVLDGETDWRWDEIEASLGSVADTGHEWDDDPAKWVREQRRSDPKRSG